MRKFLSVFLCLVMVCVYMPAIAWAEGEETEIVQDIWVYNEAREDLTWNEMNSGQPMASGDKAYLYYCGGETDTSAVPFAAETADGFRFYGAEGTTAAEAPFSIENDGAFWVITCTGDLTENYTLRYIETLENGEVIVHGDVSLEMISQSEGGDAGEEEGKYVDVKYQTDAIETIIDFMTVSNEILIGGTITDSTPLEVIHQEDGITTAKSQWVDAGVNNHWLIIEPADGYYVESFRVKAAGEETAEPYWYSTDSYFYALYDEKGERIYITEDYFEGEYQPGTIGDESLNKSVAWIEFWLNGYDPSTDNALLPEDIDMEYVGGAMAEIQAKSAAAECIGTASTYYVNVPDPDAAEYIEVVTAQVPEVEGSEIKAYGNNNEEVALSTAEEVTVTEAQKESLQNYYGNDKEIEKIYELEAEGTLDQAVEVVIPVENASEYDVVWFKDDTTPIPVTARYTEKNDGIVFTAGHFSLYALVKDADTSSEGGSGDNDGGIHRPSWPVRPGIPPAADSDKETEVETDVKTEAEKAELKAAVKASRLNAKSKLVTMASGKKAVKITWDYDGGIEFDGVQIFRSAKRYSGYGKKPIFVTEGDCYYNTAIKKGTKYYYKVRGFVIIDGEKVYTDWGSKAWRTVK